MENDSIEYESLYAYNDEFGDVINIHGNDELLKEIVTPNEFKKKIWLRNEAVKERKDKVRLAYLNKTRVHFGMTRGDFEKSAILAKTALTRNINEGSPLPHIRKIEEELLEEINQLGIGPGGLGGKTTALAVNIETYATHIAGMPLAVNMCCHVNRHVTRVL